MESQTTATSKPEKKTGKRRYSKFDKLIMFPEAYLMHIDSTFSPIKKNLL